MKLAIIGSRNIRNIDIFPHIPSGVSLIISGGAKGIDTLAAAYAKKHGAPIICYGQDIMGYGLILPAWDLCFKRRKAILLYRSF